MASDGESDASDEIIGLRRSQENYETPKRDDVYKKIEDEYQEVRRRSGRTIRQLRLTRRGPNNYIHGEHQYNTESYDPCEESDDDSMGDFVASDSTPVESDSEHEGKESDGESETDDSGLAAGNRDKSGEISSDDDAPIDVLTTRRRTSGKRIESDQEEEQEDDGPIILRRKSSSAGHVFLSQSPEPCQEVNSTSSPPYPMVNLSSPSPRRKSSSSDEEATAQETGCPAAPKKRRRNENPEFEGETSGVRRSARVATAMEERERVRKVLFDPYIKEVDTKKARLDKLATGAFVEQPPEYEAKDDEEEDEVVSSGNRLDRLEPTLLIKAENAPSPQFQSIGSLEHLPDGTEVNIRGYIVCCGPEDTRPSFRGSQERIPIRQIQVQDESGSIEITLWRGYADNPSIRKGAYVAIFGLKKNTYRDRTQLNTFYRTNIQESEPPESFSQEKLTPIKSENGNYVIEDVDPARTFVYNACPMDTCHLKKVERIDGERFLCVKCGNSFDLEDTAMGVSMRVTRRHEHSDASEMAIIFTGSVRKLFPALAMKWNGDKPVEALKEEIVTKVQEALPRTAYCRENVTGIMDILSNH